MQTEEISYNGKRLVYRTKGEGPLVVLLHGFAEDGTVWKNQYEIFPHHRLLVPDLPGSGGSEAVEDMSIEGLAEAMKALFESFAKEQKIILIGHSMGGYVALAFAEKYPEQLCGLGLFHSTAYADSEEKKATRQKGIRFMEEYGAAAFLEAATPNLFAPQTREDHPEWIEEQLQATRNFSAPSLVSYYKVMIQRPDRTAVLIDSQVPVLFASGRHDTAVPLTDSLAQCHLPETAYIHVFEHSAHMGMVEERADANRILMEYVTAAEKLTCTR